MTRPPAFHHNKEPCPCAIIPSFRLHLYPRPSRYPRRSLPCTKTGFPRRSVASRQRAARLARQPSGGLSLVLALFATLGTLLAADLTTSSALSGHRPLPWSPHKDSRPLAGGDKPIQAAFIPFPGLSVKVSSPPVACRGLLRVCPESRIRPRLLQKRHVQRGSVGLAFVSLAVYTCQTALVSWRFCRSGHCLELLESL